MWHAFKMIVLEVSALSQLQLHIIIGAVIYLLALALLRRPWLALGVTFAAQAANELADLVEDLMHNRPLDLLEHMTDTLSTLALPLLLTFLYAAWFWRR